MTATPASTEASGTALAPGIKPRTQPTDKTKSERRTPRFYQVRVLDGDVPLTGLFVIVQVDPTDPLHDAVSSAYRDAWDDDGMPGQPLRYALGFVDGDGYLQPVRGAQAGEPVSNPWHEIFPKGVMRRAPRKTKNALPSPNQNPNAWQLPGGTDVMVMLIRHPSPDRARAVLRALEDPTQMPSAHYHLPEDFTPLFHKRKMQVSGAALILDVKSLGAEAYWPPGPALYGGWNLYADMPHAHRQEVGEQVRSLREHLGLLLYAFRGGSPYSDPPNAAPEVKSAFDGGVFAAVAGFQRDLRTGKAFQPNDPSAARGKLLSSNPVEWGKPQPGWEFLLGSIVEAPGLPPPTSLSRFEEDERQEPGVVDQRTGDAIQRWLNAGCVRPFRDPQTYAGGAGSLHDPILLPLIAYQPYAAPKTNWFEWAVPDLVVRVTVLRFLLMRLGCPYGMAVSHTFREIASPGGAGKALCSIHKTGRAVDFAVVGAVAKSQSLFDYAHPVGAWPIRYEADWSIGDVSAHAKGVYDRAQSARVKNDDDLKAVDAKLERLHTKAGEHPTKAQQTQQTQLETQRKKLTAAGGELQRHESYAKIDYDRASDAADERKTGRRLRWRIFAHSTWQPPAGLDGYRALSDLIGLPIQMKPLDEVDYDVSTFLEEDVLSFLAVSLGNTQSAREWLEGPRRLVRNVVAALFGRANDGSHVPESQLPDLLDPQFGVFRTNIQPWKYKPYSASGGKPGEWVKASNETTDSREYLNEGKRERALVPASTKSFVNVTRLAAICGLHRIGPQMGSIRDPASMAHDVDDQPPPLTIAIVEPVTRGHAADHRSPGAIAGLCKQLLAEDRHKADEITIVRPDSEPFAVRVADLDVEKMGNWVRSNTADRKLPHQPHGYAIRVEVPPKIDATAAPATRRDVKRQEAANTRRHTIVKLFEGFANLLFYVIDGPGARSGLPADVVAKPKTGSEWAKIFAENGPEPKDSPSTAKLRDDWSIELQPCFLKQPPKGGLAGVPFLPNDIAKLPAPGVGRALEWWHYETAEANRKTWNDLLVSMGYERAALVAPTVPPRTDSPFAINGRGLGFVIHKVATTPDVVRGGANRAEVDGRAVENGP